MPSFEQTAEQILAQKTKGPNGIIAYSVVNETGPDGKPYFNPDSTQRPQLAYAFFETDRVGVPVVSAPGGTQDLFATGPAGEKLTIELTKEESLKKALTEIGEAAPEIKDINALEKYTVAKFLEKGWDIKIEASFSAAVREAKEEQGIDLLTPANYIGTPMQFERSAMTKRTIQDLEKKKGGPLFDLKGISDLEGVKKIVDDIKSNAPAGAAVQTPQMLFAVHVPDFSNVVPVDSGEKTEKKIKGREGAKYREQGKFVTLAQMEEQLVKALPLAQEQEERGNAFARQEIVATYERLNVFKRIEAAAVKQLQAQGVNVSSNTSSALADTPDRLVTEHAGQAAMPDAIKVRVVSRSAGVTAVGGPS